MASHARLSIHSLPPAQLFPPCATFPLLAPSFPPALLSHSLRLQILRDVTRGLQHVHGMRQLHCDIVARNVLVTDPLSAPMAEAFRARLGGFELARSSGGALLIPAFEARGMRRLGVRDDWMAEPCF